MKLRITWDGGTATFNPDDTVRIGRMPESTITIADDIVSRAHVLISFANNLWTFEDLSSNGTFIDGQRVNVGGLGGTVVMHLGAPAGPRIELELLPSEHTAPPVVATSPGFPPNPAPPMAPPPIPRVLNTALGDSRAQVGLSEPAISDPLAVPANDAVPPDDRQLRLELDGHVQVFTPADRVLVGRDLNCNVRIDSQLVSGRHCAFSHDGVSWWLDDLGSTRGTFVDHKRIQRRKVEGAFFVLLGDDDAGEPLRVITAGEHRRPTDRRPMILAGLALILVLMGGIAIWYSWPDEAANELVIAELREQLSEQRRVSEEQLALEQQRAERAIAEADNRGGAGNSPSELMTARLSTARIEVPGRDGDIIGTGSGSLVTGTGLILTNIHVVRPGLEYERTGDPIFRGLEDPEQLLVSFPSEDGGPADTFFVAEQYAVHPSHDAALIRIVDGMDGATIDDLPDPLPVGLSAGLRAGDQIAVVGYPGTAFTERVSVALSNFQSFQPCFVGSSFDEGWGCLRDYDEGYLNLAGETLAGGSSGGPIIHKGEVVGIQLGVFGEPGAPSAQNLGVPIDLITEEFDLRTPE